LKDDGLFGYVIWLCVIAGNWRLDGEKRTERSGGDGRRNRKEEELAGKEVRK
jgi:hypothetical protein